VTPTRTGTQTPPRNAGPLDPEYEPQHGQGVDARLEEIQDLLRQQQRRTTWLVVAVLLMAVTNLDLIGNALRTVLYGLLIVGILGGVYWFALQRGRQGKKL
jgi:hypothetical protein